MRLEHHLHVVGGYMRYISPHIIIIIRNWWWCGLLFIDSTTKSMMNNIVMKCLFKDA